MPRPKGRKHVHIVCYLTRQTLITLKKQNILYLSPNFSNSFLLLWRIFIHSPCLFLPFIRLWFLWPDEAGIRNKRNRNRCGCLGGCRFFGGTNMGLDYFRLEELTPSSSSAFSSSSTESDMCYGQSLLQPGEWIITKETPKVDGMDLLGFKLHFLLSSARGILL